MVMPELQAGGFVLFQGHGFIALVDVERLVSLAVSDHRLVVAVIRQGLHMVWDLDVRKRRWMVKMLRKDKEMTGLYFVLFHAVLSHQVLIQILMNIKQNSDC